MGRKFAEGFASDGYRTKQQAVERATRHAKGEPVEATGRLNLNRAD